MNRLLSFFTSFLALILTAWLVSGIQITSISAGLLAALILGLVNTVIRPVLTLFTLPLTILTFGLFLLVINGMMLSLTARLVGGFIVSGFWSAVFGALVLSVINSLMEDAFTDGSN